MPCTVSTLEAVIESHGGVLKAGKHSIESGECCINEARALCLGLPFTDNPEAVGLPDIRSLNDGPWSNDRVRTDAMVRVATALDGWEGWGREQKTRWADRKSTRLNSSHSRASRMPSSA